MKVSRKWKIDKSLKKVKVKQTKVERMGKYKESESLQKVKV